MDKSQIKLFVLKIYLPTIITSFSSGMLIPVMPLYARSFEVSYGLIGAVIAAKAVGNLLFDVPAGVWTRRWGPKPVMLVGASLVLLCNLSLVWINDLLLAIATLTISGIGWALWAIARHSYIADIVQTHQRGRSIATLGGTARMGMLAGPVVGGFIASSFGLRIPFLVFSCLILLAILVVIFLIRDTQPGTGANVDHPDRLWQVMKGNARSLVTAGSGQLCAQLVRTARHIIIPLYATDVLGLDIKSVGLIISLAAAADFLMFYPAGVLMDRFGRKYAYVPSFIIQSAGMALIPVTGGFASLQAVALLIGFGNGLGSGTMMTLGADLAPEKSRGEFLGLWRFIGDGGSAGGPLIVGGVAEVLGLLSAPVAIAGFGLAGVAILGLLVPETLRAHEEQPTGAGS